MGREGETVCGRGFWCESCVGRGRVRKGEKEGEIGMMELCGWCVCVCGGNRVWEGLSGNNGLARCKVGRGVRGGRRGGLRRWNCVGGVIVWWGDGETVYGKGFWYDNSMFPNPHFEKLAKNSENAVASRTNNK